MSILDKYLEAVKGYDNNPDAPDGYGNDSSGFDKMDVYELIDFLDKKKQLSKYRDKNAAYDDAHYNDIPLKELEKIGITKQILNKIESNTDNYDGWILIDDVNEVSIGGGD